MVMQPYCPQVLTVIPKKAKKTVKGAHESAIIPWIKTRKRRNKAMSSVTGMKLPEPPAGTSTARR